MQRVAIIACFLALTVLGCKPRPPQNSAASLNEARSEFRSKLMSGNSGTSGPPPTPARYYQLVQYPSEPGNLWAYLTPDPQDDRKYPAMVWITGGDCNTIGDVWSRAPQSNDQTASAFRDAGFIMMFPSLRGGNNNPGTREGFLGEVRDVIAAADALSRLPYVDPEMIYLGGHSSGGTLVLLVAESTERFRAVFSFGPVEDIEGYGPDYHPFDASNPKEFEVRAPGRWLHNITKPTYVFEGSMGNAMSLRYMQGINENPNVQFYLVPGKGHFDVLAPVNKLLVEKILSIRDLSQPIQIYPDELSRL